MEEGSKKSAKRKFKQTRQLVVIVQNEGWTQDDIAKACRVHQSVVSSWKKGTTLATEAQLAPLLKTFGHRLRRQSFRVYQTLIETDDEPRFLFSRVEGPVIFSHSLTDARRVNYKLEKKIPIERFVIHDQGSGFFRIIYQTRLKVDGSKEVECGQNDAIWSSRICDSIDAAAVIGFFDEIALKLKVSSATDSIVLPFLVRKSLLMHGYQVDAIVEFPATW